MTPLHRGEYSGVWKVSGNPPAKRHSVALEKACRGFVEASHLPGVVGGPAADVLLAHSGGTFAGAGPGLDRELSVVRGGCGRIATLIGAHI